MQPSLSRHGQRSRPAQDPVQATHQFGHQLGAVPGLTALSSAHAGRAIEQAPQQGATFQLHGCNLICRGYGRVGPSSSKLAGRSLLFLAA